MKLKEFNIAYNQWNGKIITENIPNHIIERLLREEKIGKVECDKNVMYFINPYTYYVDNPSPVLFEIFSHCKYNTN